VPRFGEAYAGLADVAYWQRRRLASALALYERAATTLYDCGYELTEGQHPLPNRSLPESLEQLSSRQVRELHEPATGLRFGFPPSMRKTTYFRRGLLSQGLVGDGEGTRQRRRAAPSGKTLRRIEILKLYMKSKTISESPSIAPQPAQGFEARIERWPALTHSVQLYDQLAQAPAAFEGSESRNFGLEN